MFTLRQYLTTLADTHGLTKTLGGMEVCRDSRGRMCYTVGNSAIVFRVRHEGRIRSLRCYMHHPRHLAEIYGGQVADLSALHRAGGRAEISSVINTSASKGATIDMTDILSSECESATRTVTLENDTDLVVKDIVNLFAGLSGVHFIQDV